MGMGAEDRSDEIRSTRSFERGEFIMDLPKGTKLFLMNSTSPIREYIKLKNHKGQNIIVKDLLYGQELTLYAQGFTCPAWEVFSKITE